MIPPLNGLRAFEAVARHLNFTKAADELHVTQSAVSHQIRNLEAFLGTALFDRAGGRLTLTAAGQVLLPGVREAIASIGRAVSSLKAMDEGRPLGLVTRSHFALKWLAPRLVRFWERHPGFDLRLQHANDPADFGDAAIDLAIEWRRKDALPEGARLLVEGDLTPTCSPKLLQGDDAPREPADLLAYPLLHEDDEVAWMEWLALAGAGAQTAARNHYYDDTNVRHEATVAGEGFSLACPHLIAADLEEGRLVCPFDLRLPVYGYYLVMPGGARNRRTQDFVDWLLAEAAA